MEDLLTPQICMDVDSTPLEANKNDAFDDDTSDTTEHEIDDDEKVKKLLELDVNDPAQVPDDLTEFEKEARKNVFAIGEPAVQFQRLHCTACNVHLGSAPIGHFNRYIHPLLKVLLCKSCYEFYRSGDFDKDEDGSEMYCRWCGQGGKVMCCAQCAFVFCQKCVRQNLGRKTLELIKDSDDWKCFGCNPTQLINLKIICTSLFEFEQEEIRLAKALNNAERLKLDHSVCCQKSKTHTKRKREEDATYNPNTDWEEQIRATKKPVPSILKHTLTQPPLIEEPPLVLNSQMRAWDSQDEDEVVCTPDLPSLMEEEEDKRTEAPIPSTFIPPLAPIQKTNSNASTKSKPTPSRFAVPTVQGPRKYCPISPKIIPGVNATRQPVSLNNMNNRTILLKNNIQPTLKPNSNFIRLQTPAVKFVTHTPVVGNKTVAPPVVNAHPAHIVPGLKHEWFERAATIVSTITGNLSTTLIYLTKEQKSSKTVEQLATVHNKLQELLSTSVNSLIQVRKNLRNEFLSDLNKLKFMDGSNIAVANNKSNNAKSNANSNNNNKQIIDDDDVIVINSDNPSKDEIPVSTLPVNDQPRPYLKVRSVSQLLSVPSECITIPDDPVPPPPPPPPILLPPIQDEVVPFIERDPLSLSPLHDSLQIIEPEVQISSEKIINVEESVPKSNNNEIVEVIEDTAPNKKSESVPTPLQDELSGCDERTNLMIKNALAESKIDLLVQENLKCVIEDVPAEELKKVLSVRVILATKYRPILPRNRLKTAEWFTEDIEAILSGNILIRHSKPGNSDKDVSDASATTNKEKQTLVNENLERVREPSENVEVETNDSSPCPVAAESAKVLQNDVSKNTSDVGNKDASLSNTTEGIQSDTK